MAKIYGICSDNKCRREVPSKEDFDALAKKSDDTDWITLVEAGTRDAFVFSAPLKYRKIGNKVCIKGRISSISSSSAGTSKGTTITGLPSDCTPPEEIKITPAINHSSTNGVQFLELTIMTMGHIYLRFYSETAVSNQSFAYSINTEYLVD